MTSDGVYSPIYKKKSLQHTENIDIFNKTVVDFWKFNQNELTTQPTEVKYSFCASPTQRKQNINKQTNFF